jgi:peptidoglycan/xylan/chitin deacetylase (PgdA/CDA1 family)
MQLLSVNFHYIRDSKPKQGIYPRSLKEFENQISELSHYYEFISQDELKKIISDKGNSSGKYCIITFDDNLKEQISVVDFLQKQSVPALFFSTTYPYINNDVHDVHKTHQIFIHNSDNEMAAYLDKKFGFHNVKFSKEQLDNSYSYDNKLKKKIKLFLNFILKEDQRKEVLNELFLKSVDDLKDFISEFYFSKEDLKFLASRGMLGTHSHSHLPLASLSAEDAMKEISISIKYLEKLTKTKIKAILYPYGRNGAVDATVSSISKKLGLEIGFTMNRGINNIDNLIDPLMLMRVDTNDAPGGKSRSKKFYPR